MPIPFNHTLLLWRRHRGLTQEQLARAAGLPRPNLCAIERGQREVTLATLRALSVALDVRPGILVDGIPPEAQQMPIRWSREALERVAQATAQGSVPAHPGERLLAELLRQVTRRSRPRAAARRWASRRGETAWLMLEALCQPAVLQSLLARIEDRQRIHAS